MSEKLIGRKEERALLLEALHTGRSEMVAVLGRRRVGKTFLIRQVYGDQIVFSLTGLQTTALPAQLQNFSYQLGLASGSPAPVKTPKKLAGSIFYAFKFSGSATNAQKNGGIL